MATLPKQMKVRRLVSQNHHNPWDMPKVYKNLEKYGNFHYFTEYKIPNSITSLQILAHILD